MNDTNNVIITPESVMKVEGVLYSDWIPCLKGYGPFRKCSIKVKDIVNLINNDISVLLRDDQNEKLYFFVKQYNELIKLSNSPKPRADRAEEVLFKRVYGKSLEIERENDRDNPFVDDEIESIDIAAETIAAKSNGTSHNDLVDPLANIKNKQQVKKVHAYDVFNSTSSSQSVGSRLDEVNDIINYGNCDFEME